MGLLRKVPGRVEPAQRRACEGKGRDEGDEGDDRNHEARPRQTNHCGVADGLPVGSGDSARDGEQDDGDDPGDEGDEVANESRPAPRLGGVGDGAIAAAPELARDNEAHDRRDDDPREDEPRQRLERSVEKPAEHRDRVQGDDCDDEAPDALDGGHVHWSRGDAAHGHGDCTGCRRNRLFRNGLAGGVVLRGRHDGHCCWCSSLEVESNNTFLFGFKTVW